MEKQKSQPIMLIRRTRPLAVDAIGAYMQRVTVFLGQLSGVLILVVVCFMSIVLMGLWHALALIVKPLYGDSELRR